MRVHMGHVSREMETIKESKGTSRNKKARTEMKNAFDGLISKCDTVEFNELEERSAETFQTEMQGEKNMKKNKPRDLVEDLWENFKRYNMYVIRIPEEKKKRTEQRKY